MKITPKMVGSMARNENPLTRVKVKSPSQLTGDEPSKRLIKRRKATQKAPPGYYANPLVRVKVKSPSMATGEEPSKRLTKRRKATQKAPPGYYANPVQSPQLAVRLNAGNDRNGNPRQGLLIVELIDQVEPRYLGFVDLGYSSPGAALRDAGYDVDMAIIGTFDIAVTEFNNLKRQGARWVLR